MIWPPNIENPEFLLTIYGNYPNLMDIEVQELALNYNGPTAKLRFLTSTLPYKPPTKWGDHNQVAMEISLIDLSDLVIRKFWRNGHSVFNYSYEYGQNKLKMIGAVEAEIVFRFFYIERITPILSDQISD